MKTATKVDLIYAWKYCDDEDKSTEFMLQFMQDTANVDLDCVLNFIEKYGGWEDAFSKNKKQIDLFSIKIDKILKS